ncbi:ribonuclease Z [Nocardiopsis potens]|uniref:ribonuclease Z n=1 Tax=Nocardiopsis potens TaxID=1246458 RepID=UPI000367748E|nr:ribonuclease Z [Nocardiopsis potens]
MSVRELVVLGTSSAVPTKRRNHNGYFLRWDGGGLLFDPGEGTQRQMRFAGLAAADITRICVTHFHGDHCLGLPGVVQRISRDRVQHTVRAVYPEQGEEYWRRLRHATSFTSSRPVVGQPVGGEGACPLGDDGLHLTALPLDHSIPAYGYRVQEPDGWRMVPERLAAAGVTGPDIGRLQREGELRTPSGRTVALADCAEPRPGQAMAFVMDTGMCDNAFRLADGADLLVIESTYLDADASLARSYRHLTAGQAGRIAAESGVRRLVLTHISERYDADQDPRFIEEAAAHFSGDIVLAQDLARIKVPKRRP